MAKSKEKRAPHLLDSLFKAAIRAMSFSQFKAKEAEILPLMPHPWAWPDPKTDTTWTLLGRKAHLLWNASITHYVKNHSLAEHAIQLAITHNKVWNESEPGKPDILMMWLASCRYGGGHARTQNLLARALKNSEPGLGKPGDGGYLDKLIGIVENEVASKPDKDRLYIIHGNAVDYWLRGTILGTQGTMQADWRPVCYGSLPTDWPQETIERVFRLHNRTCGDSKMHISIDGGRSLIRQMGATPSQGLLDAIIENAMAQGFEVNGTLTTGALLAIDHGIKHDLVVDPALIEALAPHEDRLTDTPFLRAVVSQHLLQDNTHSANHAGPKRLRL
jgi:hypothetical protein